MPCSKYKSPKQKALCFATDGFKDWSKIKLDSTKLKKKKNAQV